MCLQLQDMRYQTMIRQRSASANMFKEGNSEQGTGQQGSTMGIPVELYNSIDEQGHQLSRSTVGTYNSMKVKEQTAKKLPDPVYC